MKLWWIKERQNPQLGTYYVACGQMSKKEALRKEETLYGSNIMRSYKTERDYKAQLEALRKNGERVRGGEYG